MSVQMSLVHPRPAAVMSSELATAFDCDAVVTQFADMSLRGLARMYDPHERLFVFRLRRTAGGIVREGLSPRYSAISLIGLSTLPGDAVNAVLGPHSAHDVCARLIGLASESDNLGDVALTIWAAGLLGYDALEPAVARLVELEPADRVHPVVELAWTVSALSEVPLANRGGLRDTVAARLMSTFNSRSRLFPHLSGGAPTPRAHVACFADLIYPIQALAKFAAASGSARALDIASTAGAYLCSLQGDDGQWWWHYDYRTGQVIERYPVYAIHQDAMGPMGLFALMECGGPDVSASIVRGMQWLTAAPELDGGSLVDEEADLIWRKVARREPNKASRYIQATVSRVHPSLRVPALDRVFPARGIDYEDRPYHLGWLLYAWAGKAAAACRRNG